MAMAGLTISRFAATAGVGVETVRFYQRRGLLAVPERQGSGYREYSEADQRRLAFICGAKLDQTQQQLTELVLLRCRLQRLVRVCADGAGEDCLALRLGEPVPAVEMP
jgi:MerR HTH family regulatory protein